MCIPKELWPQRSLCNVRRSWSTNLVSANELARCLKGVAERAPCAKDPGGHILKYLLLLMLLKTVNVLGWPETSNSAFLRKEFGPGSPITSEKTLAQAFPDQAQLLR